MTMTVLELGAVLGHMYREAPRGEVSTMIHLFGVRYADRIRESGCTGREIAIAAGIAESYGNEILKGVRLARYVVPR